MCPRFASFSRRIYVVAALAVIVALIPRNALAQERRAGGGAYAGRSAAHDPYILRPLSVEPRHAELLFGLGIAGRAYANTVGGGFAFDGAVGIVRGLEIGGGLGARFAGGNFLNAETFARVNREWIPLDDRVNGQDTFLNPYFRVRYAFINALPFMIGIEGYLNLPFARYVAPPVSRPSCWGPGIGLPIHFVVGHRVRFETGFFHQFIACPDGGPLETAMLIPFRVNFGITDRFWLGIRADFSARNYRFDYDNYALQAGLQAGVRVIQQLDLVWDIVFPQFIHYDPALNRNVFFEVWGAGFSAVVRVP